MVHKDLHTGRWENVEWFNTRAKHVVDLRNGSFSADDIRFWHRLLSTVLTCCPVPRLPDVFQEDLPFELQLVVRCHFIQSTLVTVFTALWHNTRKTFKDAPINQVFARSFFGWTNYFSFRINTRTLAGSRLCLYSLNKLNVSNKKDKFSRPRKKHNRLTRLSRRQWKAKTKLQERMRQKFLLYTDFSTLTHFLRRFFSSARFPYIDLSLPLTNWSKLRPREIS